MPAQGQRLTTTQSLAQKQVITQKLIQSIKLMAMPLTELRETIQLEVEKNPALEVVREAGEVDAPSLDENRTREDRVTETDPFDNSSDPGYQPAPKGDPDSKQRFLEGAVSREKSLHDHLIDQLRLMKGGSDVANLAEKIIWNLDGDGFHQEDPALLAGTDSDSGILKDALNLVRGMDPLGCGCADWKESLLVQATIRGDGPEEFALFVNDALPLLETKRPEDVRSRLGISKDDWEDFEEYIRTLNPFPGRLYATEAAQYIIPDLVVRKDEGEYVLILNDEVLPVLRVDPEFERIRDEAGDDKDARRFVSDHSREARYFINSLVQRENTLLKAARSIVEFQRDFFIGGPRFLKPLTLKDVAGEIGVHEATVSRITTNKYVQTDWGLFELKYFFTNSISGAGSSGSRVSKVAAKEVIKEILAETDPNQKISDQKLSDLLARRGINLARRTVAKYRKELDLPSSYNR
ncbi:MAG: RNA polymerase factor sigma-54 [Spirochaetaceae bacterium]|nr:RNA polymerase factor sigma-54 [Spirochaetaceae bacterium]